MRIHQVPDLNLQSTYMYIYHMKYRLQLITWMTMFSIYVVNNVVQSASDEDVTTKTRIKKEEKEEK